MTFNYEEQEDHFSKQQRLHPAAMFFEFMTVFKETIFGFGIGLLFTLKSSVLYFFLFATIFITFLILYTVLSWWRFTYRIEKDELRIEQGVFIRKKRYISIHRIHKIDLTANIVHRFLKLVKIQVDTASNQEGSEVYLSAIPTDKAVELRKRLQHTRNVREEGTLEEDKIHRKITWRQLFIAGSTSGSAGFIILAILTAFTQIEELIPRKLFNEVYSWFVHIGLVFIIVFALIIFLFIWILGIAGTMIRYGHFYIEKREKELFIRRGLIETKELTIPFERIQAIGVEQSLIRQPFGYVRLYAVVAGGSFDKLESFPILFPLLHEQEINVFLEKFLPSYAPLMEDKLIRLPKRSFPFYLLRNSFIPFLLFIGMLFFLPLYSWLPLLLVGLSIILAWMQYKDFGYYVTGQKLVFQRRHLQKTRMITSKRRIQAVERRQHKLQTYVRLVSFTLSLIGSSGLGTHYTFKALPEDEAEKIASWYSYKKKDET